MTTKASNWTNRLITGLFTAAAAWGSVTVEINRTVNARAEITEQRIEQHITEAVQLATRDLATQQRAIMDSLAHGFALRTATPTAAAPHITVQAPLDTAAATRQAALADRLEAIETRLRFVAIAIARKDAEREKRQPQPKYGPGYRNNDQ